MGADKSRSTYDPAQQYRLVVYQQGRVSTDADPTEAGRILSEETRAHALDFVGPSGSPDDGYLIDVPAGLAAFDFRVNAGTLYAGGLRLFLRAAFLYSAQPDWLDRPAVSPPAGGHEHVSLRLAEQEVSAVEDAELREVALGGPDTAQRLRLIRHVERRTVKAADCAGALAEVIQQWDAEGWAFDPATLRLRPKARLQVSQVGVVQKPDPCKPESQGGYLGADNQLIRVQLLAGGQFVWGYDNASFLYPVTLSADGQTVTLQQRPVDAYHRPRKGQAVEVLRAGALLANGNYVAAAAGFVVAAQNDYDPDAQTLALAAAVPAASRNADPTLPYFLRVWENVQPFVVGQALELKAADGAGTGLAVTLDGALPAGAFWEVAVRPETTRVVDPPRLLQGPCPASGPRAWACPLAVLAWKADGTPDGLPADCRPPFDNLVILTGRLGGGCCTATVKPAEAARLQDVLDRVGRVGGTVCLTPGHYRLPRPLRLGPAHAGLTLEGCQGEAVLEADPAALTKFLDGLVVLVHANNVTLRDLRFHLPLVPFVKAGGKMPGLDPVTLRELHLPPLEALTTSVGVRPFHCARLAVRDCLFRFALPRAQPVFAAGLFAASECWGLTVEGCRFLHEEKYLLAPEPFRCLAGYLLAPHLGVLAREDAALARARLALAPALLEDARFAGNEFAGLTQAVVALSDLGVVRLEGNRVRGSLAGFLLLSQSQLAALIELASEPALAGLLFGPYYPPPAGAPALPAPVSAPPTRPGAKPTAKAPSIAEELRPGGAPAELPPRLRLLAQELAALGSAGAAAAVNVDRLPLALHAQGNQVEAVIHPGAGFALAVSFTFAFGRVHRFLPEAAATLAGNHWHTSGSALATVTLAGVKRGAVAGDLIRNDGVVTAEAGPVCLRALQFGDFVPLIAVAGNALHGRVFVPGWPQQWQPLNAVEP